MVSVAMAAPQEPDLPYPLVPLEVTGTVDGHDFDLQGTYDSVIAQLEKQYPEAFTNITEKHPSALVVTKRDTSNKSGLICCDKTSWPWQYTLTSDVRRVINNLRTDDNAGYHCKVRARSCTRLNCYGDSSIILCNDNTYDIQPACAYLATYAEDIINGCTRDQGLWGPGSPLRPFSCGQKFDTDRYNVIVRSFSCAAPDTP
ncbi:hypothetical protein GLAREA_04084 [Glarea lozoyensis ATCC 20868]|uniref:Secreted protein n=2 Tax=Glarea lozoyensis TaxID=101852 RepID=S3CXP7_GLAL2|nr:uncharacterized protein GLAREA_04084 [Glarea lozoyensis ATCC 20868]EHL02917.1 hypothetical protein M7I_0883 [Glarea lozoyensis 74030]EPE31117.1 hypothetical protein GLAREA_04084 [Glarea lozoyensis ATCC 20868]